MTDRIVLGNMRFQARHGVHDYEKVTPQPFEVDVELVTDLQPAGIADDLTLTIDYGKAYAAVQGIVETRTYDLLEALAEAIAHDLLAGFDVPEVVVRIRKPAVKLGGPLDYAGVEIRRQRPTGAREG